MTPREPVPLDATPEPMSQPMSALREPTADFLNKLAVAIRGGARPSAAAEWLGVSPSKYKAWLKRKGPAFDALRATRRSALAHLKVRLQADIAKRHPERALRSLHVREEQAEDGRYYSDSKAPRPYAQGSGHTLVAKALPYLVERVNDAAISDADLSPIERAARDWRRDVISDLGGAAALTAAKLSVVNAATGSMIIQSSIDHYLFELAGADGLVSRKHRRLFPVVEQRMRIADSLTRQLQALGLDRAQKATDLTAYVNAKYALPSASADEARTTDEAHS